MIIRTRSSPEHKLLIKLDNASTQIRNLLFRLRVPCKEFTGRLEEAGSFKSEKEFLDVLRQQISTAITFCEQRDVEAQKTRKTPSALIDYNALFNDLYKVTEKNLSGIPSDEAEADTVTMPRRRRGSSSQRKVAETSTEQDIEMSDKSSTDELAQQLKPVQSGKESASPEKKQPEAEQKQTTKKSSKTKVTKKKEPVKKSTKDGTKSAKSSKKATKEKPAPEAAKGAEEVVKKSTKAGSKSAKAKKATKEEPAEDKPENKKKTKSETPKQSTKKGVKASEKKKKTETKKRKRGVQDAEDEDINLVEVEPEPKRMRRSTRISSKKTTSYAELEEEEDLDMSDLIYVDEVEEIIPDYDFPAPDVFVKEHATPLKSILKIPITTNQESSEANPESDEPSKASHSRSVRFTDDSSDSNLELVCPICQRKFSKYIMKAHMSIKHYRDNPDLQAQKPKFLEMLAEQERQFLNNNSTIADHEEQTDEPSSTDKKLDRRQRKSKKLASGVNK